MSDIRKSTKTTLCKYFLNGVCRKGGSCEFSHDRNNAPSRICTFYLQGACAFGSKCRYDHIKEKNVIKAPVSASLQLSDVNNGASSSGMQAVPNKLKYKGQEFVPGQQWVPPSFPSYSEAAQVGLSSIPTGVTCEHCSEVIQPYESDHLENCLKYQEKEMEDAFRAKVSSEKICGICLDVVWEKEPKSKKRFGILSDCNHVYCLECIRTWRGNDSEGDTTRLCPECRTKSNFVVPSYHWFDNDEEKIKLINDYKDSLKSKPCRYFSKDQFCQFGEKCFYLHLNPDGTRGRNKRRYKEDANGLVDLIEIITLSEFLDSHLYEDDNEEDDDDDDDDDYYGDDYYDYVFNYSSSESD